MSAVRNQKVADHNHARTAAGLQTLAVRTGAFQEDFAGPFRRPLPKKHQNRHSLPE
jgi:hypothetical protein